MSMFGGIFGSNTPQYKGLAQPAVKSGGVFSLITGLFAPSDPTYVRPQPEPAVSPSTAPASPPSGEVPSTPDGAEQGLKGAPEPQGRHITIIVKPGPGTSVEEVVQFLQDRCLDD